MSSGRFSRFVDFLRDAFTANLGLKALSLAFALGLFAYLKGRKTSSSARSRWASRCSVPSEESPRELMTQLPATIHVTLRGPARVIDRLIQSGMQPLTIDLRSGERESIAFDERMFSLPPEARITLIDPPSLELEWEDVITRQIPVQASITGQPSEGYVVKGGPEVEPKHITARGPVSVVEVLQFARLAAFDVSGLSEGAHKRRLSIDAPPTRVRYLGPAAATVTVTVARRVSERVFAERPVEVIGPAAGVVVPRTVEVTVIGPPEVVQALKPEQVVPRADLSQGSISRSSATARPRPPSPSSSAAPKPRFSRRASR